MNLFTNNQDIGLTKTDSLNLKGIAILLLIFHHLFHHLYSNPSRFAMYSISFYPFSLDFIALISFMAKICVSIFAFITGYGLLKSIEKIDLEKKSVEIWSIKRLLKTMGGFYFIYIIMFLSTLIIDKLPIQKYFSESITMGVYYVITDFLGLSNLFSTPSLCDTWWYMTAAIIFILSIPIIYALSRKIGYIPIVIAIIALPRLMNVGYPGGINPYTFLLPVVFGMIFSEYDIFERISKHMPKNRILAYFMPFAIFGALIISFYLMAKHFAPHEIWEYYYGVAPLFIICFSRYCITRLPLINIILEFLGKHSMTIFLTHTFLRWNYLNEFIYSQGNFIIIFLVLLVLSIVLAVIIDKLKELIYDEKYANFTNKIIKNIEK